MVKQGKDNHILIICPSMWPEMNSWGETQRMYYLANDLAKHGFHVCTIAPAYEGESGKVNREQYYTSYFFGTERSAESIQKAQNASGTRAAASQILHRMAAAVLTPIVRWFYNEPSYFEGIKKQIWLMKYRKDILAVVEKEEISEVLISVPEFVLLRCGKIIHKKYPGIKVFYDYRDPWHLWNKSRNPAYYREKRYLLDADYVIGFSDPFCKDMVKEMGVPKEKVFLVYNGYSEKDWELFEEDYHPDISDMPLRGAMRITYTGNLSLADNKENYRNLNSLIQIIKKYPEIELFLVGIGGVEADVTEENIHYVGKVAQRESFHYMAESDVVLSIHDAKDCSGNYLISGKFFDYIRSGKVIWHIGTRGSLMGEMVHSYHLGIACENREEELEAIIKMLLEQWENGTLGKLRNCSEKDIRFFSRERQNARYRNILRAEDHGAAMCS